MSSAFKTKEFLELKAFWYQALKESGFLDNEEPVRTCLATPDQVEAKETYYSIALEFLALHQFRCQVEREIWRLHCEGIGYKRIAQTLGITGYQAESTYKKFQQHLNIRPKRFQANTPN